MRAASMLMTLALGLAAQAARAGVAVSVEAGADAAVPRISLRTSLTPMTGPGLGEALAPGLNASPAPGLAAPVLAAPAAPSLAAPSALTAQALPAPLPASAVVAAPHGGPRVLAAASSSDGSKREPEKAASPAAKAEPGAPSFKSKILGLLRSFADPFGKKAAPEENPGAGPLHPLLSGESNSLELQDLGYKGSRLQKGGVGAKSLGVGMRGFVDAHPSIDGAVVKTVRMAGSSNAMIAAEELTEHALSEKEEKVARELEALGAGPRYFGKTTLEGRLVSVRERIYGKTIEKLMSERSYGPEEHALVLAMLRKLAGAGVTATDLKAENIMIGRTAADGARKAWLVDGGSLSPLPKDLAEDKRLDAVLDSWVPTMSQFGTGTSLRKITDKGLKRFKGEPPPKNEAERLDREFTKLDVWTTVAPSARAEIETLRARGLSKADFKEHVRSAARAAMARMQADAGTNNIGFHYNLHGGQRKDYVGKGINATMGDIALQYSMHGDRNYKVYFFQSAQHDLYNLLDESHPQMLLFPSRMGHALNLFDVDAPAILAAKADGRIRDHGAISMDFHGMGGVPYSAYLAPPVEVFHRTAKKLGLKKLTRDEETLATIRYLEAVVAAGAPYIPR